MKDEHSHSSLQRGRNESRSLAAEFRSAARGAKMVWANNSHWSAQSTKRLPFLVVGFATNYKTIGSRISASFDKETEGLRPSTGDED